MVKERKYHLKKHILQICQPSSTIFNSNDNNMKIVSEGLFGEKFQVVQKKNAFVYGKLLSDNYKGWMKKDDLCIEGNVTHKVSKLRTFVYEKNDIKSNVILTLPYGSKVNIESMDDEWSKLNLLNFQFSEGFLLSSDISSIDHQIKDWVTTAEMFINTPYKWGGRNSIGIDCSALLQISLSSSGIQFPRDTCDQILSSQIFEITKDQVSRGSLVYWRGHCAIFTDEINIIHSNAFHMNVKKEPFNLVSNRIEHEYNSSPKFFKVI